MQIFTFFSYLLYILIIYYNNIYIFIIKNKKKKKVKIFLFKNVHIELYILHTFIRFLK